MMGFTGPFVTEFSGLTCSVRPYVVQPHGKILELKFGECMQSDISPVISKVT